MLWHFISMCKYPFNDNKRSKMNSCFFKQLKMNGNYEMIFRIYQCLSSKEPRFSTWIEDPVNWVSCSTLRHHPGPAYFPFCFVFWQVALTEAPGCKHQPFPFENLTEQFTSYIQFLCPTWYMFITSFLKLQYGVFITSNGQKHVSGVAQSSHGHSTTVASGTVVGCPDHNCPLIWNSLPDPLDISFHYTHFISYLIFFT